VFKKFLMMELTALLSRSDRATATFSNFYVSHSNTKSEVFNYIYFSDNSLLFPTVKEFFKSVNS